MMTYSTSSKTVKRFLILLLVVAVALSAVVLVSCKDDKTDVTIEVNTVEDLKGLTEYLGDYSDYATTLTINLNADLDLGGEEWSPLGKDYDSSFRGTFNGNGHKITNFCFNGVKDDKEVVTDGSLTASEYNPMESQYVGLFGYVSNAEFNNLTIEYTAKFRAGKERPDGENVDYSTLYFGGLAAFAYGDCTYNNISVIGNVDIASSFVYDTNREGVITRANAYDAYVGGMVGYATGTTVANNLNSDVKVNMPNNALQSYDGTCEIDGVKDTEVKLDSCNSRFGDAKVGGLFGYVRTYNISLGNANGNTISNAIVKLDADINAETAMCGGLVGCLYNTSVNNYQLTIGSDIVLNASTRGELGGVVGMCDNCQITYVLVELATGDYLQGAMPSKGSTADYITSSIGGAVGYATNGTTLTNVAVKANIASRMGCVDYAGGIVGVLDGSAIKNAVAIGGFFEENAAERLVTIEKSIGYRTSDYKFGGVVGRANAVAEVSDTAVSFVAPKAVVGTVTQKIVYKKTTDENGEDVYEKDDSLSKPSSTEAEDGTVILENYIDDATVFYNPDASLEKDAEIGTAKADDAYFTQRFEQIKAEII